MANSEKEIKKLTEQEEGEVSGAEIIKSSSEWPGYDSDHVWWVVNSKTGAFEGKFATKEQARYEAQRLGYKPDRIWMRRTVDRMQLSWEKHRENGGTCWGWENPFGK